MPPTHRKQLDIPPEPTGNGATGRGTTRRRALLTAAGGSLASVIGVGRSGAARTTGGDELWRFRAFYGSISSPTVVDGTVYVGTGVDDDMGLVYALNSTSGNEEWNTEFDSRVRAPAVVDGSVFVAGARDDRGTVYALDARRGTDQWNGAQSLSTNLSSPTAFDGTVYVNSGPYLNAFNTATGTHRWQVFKSAGSQSPPTVVDGTVYVDGGHSVIAFDAETGERRWYFDTGDRIWSQTVIDETVYVGNRDGTVYSLDATDGTERWRFEIGESIHTTPTVHEGSVYVGSLEGSVYAIDAGLGEERWRFRTGDEVWSSPTVVDDHVFVGSNDGNVYAIHADSGAERWRFQTEGSIFSSPTVVDGTVFVGNDDSTLYALDAGIQGSSEDSRVLLGTEGHHRAWAARATADTAPDEFAVELDAAPMPAIRGEELTVSVTLENVGEQTGEREIRYRGFGSVAGEFEDTVALAGGESRTMAGTARLPETYASNELALQVSVWEDEAALTVPVTDSPWRLDRIPGGPLGALGGVGGLGGAGYLLKRRFADE